MSTKLQTVKRYDRAINLDAKRVIRTDEGYMRAPARLTRAGVFHYRNPTTGEKWSELRLPEEVFKADSLASFELLPVINDHIGPSIAVTSDNAKRVQVGSVGSVKQDAEDPNYVSGTVLITDGATIEQVERGKCELSPGYFCEKEPVTLDSNGQRPVYKDPVTGTVEAYDFIQRNIRGNHVAIVEHGRSGPGARIMLDHNDAIEHTDGEPVTTQRKDQTMKKITIDGISFEVSEACAQAYEKQQTEHRANTDRLTATNDSAQIQVKKLTADLATASDPKRLADAVSTRVALVQAAAAHEVKTDGLDDSAIRRAVITKINPELKLDGKSEEYVRAAYDFALTRNPVVDQLSGANTDGVQPVTTTHTDAASKGAAHRVAHAKGFFGHDATKRLDQ